MQLGIFFRVGAKLCRRVALQDQRSGLFKNKEIESKQSEMQRYSKVAMHTKRSEGGLSMNAVRNFCFWRLGKEAC